MIKLPSIFSQGMVLNKQARIWGWTEPNTHVTIIFQGKGYTAISSPEGCFETTVTSEYYGGPHNLTIGDITITDVHVGQVWLCGGQSNMEQPLSRTRPLLNQYIKPAPHIRAFHAEKGMCFSGPATDVKGSWQPATGDALESTFAVPYFFAQTLAKSQINIPIGLVNVAAGGTPAEAWLPEDIIRTFPELYEKLEPYMQPGFAQALEKSEEARVQEWHKTLQSKDMGLKEGWHAPDSDYDDTHWEEKMLLDNNSLEHGAVWYRQDIWLTRAAKSPVVLSFGRVVDSVQVYVNGEMVTSVDYQYPPCRCTIPENLLKPGSNTIAIRVVGSSNKPHIIPGKRYEITHKNGTIDLHGYSTMDMYGPWHWRRRQGCTMPRLEPAKWLYDIPTCTYNYMLAPVLGYSISGVIWYQGESNTGSPKGYKTLFAAFVALLRQIYGEDLPVIFTQLANFTDPHGTTGENWAELREEQRQCQEIPNTAMAVAIDCGEYNDIHPQDKKTIGERLALCARRIAYAEDIVASGPVAKNAIIRNGKLIIRFTNATGLWAKNGRPVLELIDASKVVHHLYANIEGETLTAQVSEIDAKHVRFAWTDSPAVVLYNAYGLPAPPFNITISC